MGDEHRLVYQVDGQESRGPAGPLPLQLTVAAGLTPPSSGPGGSFFHSRILDRTAPTLNAAREAWITISPSLR